MISLKTWAVFKSPSLAFQFHRHASKLVYSEYGPAYEVISRVDYQTPERPSNSENVLVKMLMSTINPADLNTIQGTYPIKPDLPAVGGGEGVGVIEAIGENVKSLEIGDLVIPSLNMAGTWNTHMDDKESSFIKVPDGIPLEAAATLRVNPGTAFQMLTQFVKLDRGDVVIQNGANSAAGQALIQIAKKFGLVTLNLVRNRENIQELKKDLTAIGADYVWTEEEFRKTQLLREGTIPKPKLAINCVGGQSSTEIGKSLAHGGYHVTYGGMSLKPVTIPTSALIFKDITVKGFWFSRWMEEDQKNNGKKESEKLFEFLSQMVLDRELKSPRHTIVPLSDYQMALEQSGKGFKNTKFMLNMDPNSSVTRVKL